MPTIFAQGGQLDAPGGSLARPGTRAAPRRGGASSGPPRQPAWLREVAAAVSAEIEARSGGPVRVDLGPAVPEPSTAPTLTARFRVDLRGVRVDVASLQELWLAPPADPERRAEVVEVVAHDADVLTVVAPARTDDVHLFASSDPLPPLRALLDGITGLRSPGLADRFDTKVLDRPPPGPHRRPGLGPEEAAAWAASCAPGMNVVWAPPGTDKTRVIADVVAQLTLSGKSVLLVSATGVAVDQDLLEASRVLVDTWPGRLVRVGYPRLMDLADHPFLRLERACEELAGEQRARLAQIERRVAELRAEPDLLVLERAERLLASFDGRAYERALGLAANAERLAALRRQADELAAAGEAARQGRSAARTAAGRADAAVAEAAGAREAYQRVDEVQRELGGLAVALEDAREAVRQLRERLAEAREAAAGHADLPVARRVAKLGATGRYRVAQADLENRLVPAWERVVELERRSDQARIQIEALEEAAKPFTRQEVDRRDQARREARDRLDAAARAVRDNERAARALGRELGHAARDEQPGPADVELVRSAEAQSLPGLAARISELRAAAAAGTDELERLAEEHRLLATEITAMAPRVVAGASVVATTLERLAADPAVHGRSYDHVLVDEVSTALPPYVVYAATRAGTGVTLVGDFLQNGPASAFETSKALPVSRWLLRDSLTVLGVDRPSRALAHRGCSVLSEQQRLGPATAELVNRTAYEWVLRTVPATRPGLPGDGLGELVLVDVSGYGELARIRTGVASGRREWWPIGALLARAIARYHERLGQPVAILAPHAMQARVTEAAVLDADLDPRVEVGTPHRFQSRLFPVAVLDLVEDRRERGWLARGRIGGTRHELRGLRLFDVGATRATGRTYLLADRLAVERAERGPLAHLRDMVGEGRIAVVGAGRFLPLRRHPARVLPAGPAPAASQVPDASEGPPGSGSAAGRGGPAGSAGPDDRRGPAAAVVARPATPARPAVPAELPTYETAAFFSRLERDLAAAERDVWIWSPFLATRPSRVLPWLRAAAQRGCRVTVFVKPGHEHRPNDERRVGALREADVTVVGIYGLVERLVVIDDRLSFLGNLTVLATPRERGEAMALVEGGRFARQLLEHHQAEAFSEVPTCPVHASVRCFAQHYRRGRHKGWFWTCPRCDLRRQVDLRG